MSLHTPSLRRISGLLFILLFSLLSTAAPNASSPDRMMGLEERADTSRLVFAHFLVGIVSDRTSAADYDADMRRAKEMGIDAFALNIGTNDFTDQQLDYAYESAANNGMKVFISFDFNWWTDLDAAAVGRNISQYASRPAQLKIGGKVFASSFLGNGLDVALMRNASGVDVYWAPNYWAFATDVAKVDAALNWAAWPNDGANRAPTAGANHSVEEGDAAYTSWLAGKPYIAPVAPWFFTHFGTEVSWSKNWIFPSDLLWFNRWKNILALGPRFVEIISWNDYGESHYIAPLSSKHYDDGSSKWVNDMPHIGWMDMAKPFIAAYKAGASSPDAYITSDQLIYWYRPTPKSANCDATDNAMGKPEGWEQMADSVFVVALLTAPGTVTVTSGNITRSFSAPAGANAFEVPMGVGAQQFSLTRDSRTVLSGRSLRDVSDVCPCGMYNFNAYVGTLPEGNPDALDADGLRSFTEGLKVGTCAPTPSLASGYYQTAPVPTAIASSTSTILTSPISATSTKSSSTSSFIVTTSPVTTSSTSSQSTTTSSKLTSTSSKPSTTSSSTSTTSKPTSTSFKTTSTSSKPSTTFTTPKTTSTSSKTTSTSSSSKVTSTSSTSKRSSTSSVKPSTTTTSKASTTTSKPTTAFTSKTTSTSSVKSSTTTSKTSTATSKPSTTSKPTKTTTSKTTSTSKPTTTTAAAFCTKGTNAPGTSGNLAGLCDYACHFNYCPAGSCVCTATAKTPVAEPRQLGVKGCPAPGMGDSYKGLCSYACNRGYCPAGACVKC